MNYDDKEFYEKYREDKENIEGKRITYFSHCGMGLFITLEDGTEITAPDWFNVGVRVRGWEEDV